MGVKNIIKKIMESVLPSYRVARRLEQSMNTLMIKINHIENRIQEVETRNDMLFWFSMGQEGEELEKIKKRFFLSLPVAEGELRERQLKGKYILEEFRKICEEHNLTYWLEGGTLLGAIRHEGFIPWDDDIDVNMPESDLMKLKELLKDNATFCFRNKYNYRLCCIIPGMEMRDGSEGWIDIFPMKYTSSEELGHHFTKKKINDACAAMRRELISECKDKNPGVDFVDMDCGDKEQVETIQTIMNKYLEQFPDEENADCCYRSLSALNSPGGADLFYINDVFPLMTASFEGTEYCIPADYDKWLKTYYGDYYRIPRTITPKHF